jgi:hypothetical protein
MGYQKDSRNEDKCSRNEKAVAEMKTATLLEVGKAWERRKKKIVIKTQYKNYTQNYMTQRL